MMPSYFQITPALSEFHWDMEVSDELLQRQLALKVKLEEEFQQEIIDIRIGFKTLGISWKKEMLIDRWFEKTEIDFESITLSSKIWKIPVCYDEAHGKDLLSLASSKKIEPQKLINLHSTPEYRIHFFGFLPGFMYLQGLNPLLHSPRKKIPELRIEPGSVAIGGSQTGIYPSASPGGWHIIGQTPIPLFDPTEFPPVFASPGDKIKFIPIDKEEFDEFKRNPSKPSYQ